MCLMPSGRTLKVVFLLLLLLFTPPVHSITVIQETRWTLRPSFKITANMSCDNEPYSLFVGTVRAVSFQIPGVLEINKCPRLPRQVNGKVPPCWITVELLGKGEQITEIALRCDNLDLVGFKNKEGKWFELKPRDGQDQLIPGATLLNFGGSYTDLLGPGGYRNLAGRIFGKSTFLEAVGTLFNYPDNISEVDLKLALMYLIVMICEAARMDPIENKINSGWRLGGTQLDRNQQKYTVNWGQMCYYVLCDTYGSKWTNAQADDLPKIDVTSIDIAKGIINIYLWPVNFDNHNVDEACTRRCNNS